LLALSAAFLSPVTSAHAGSWKLSCTGSGTATASADGTAKPTHTWTAPATVAAPTSAAPGQPVPGSSITLPSVSNGASWVTVVTPEPVVASASLNATVTGTWVPNPALASDPAPPSVILTETSTATGVQMHTDSSGNTVTTAGSANDWLGDPVGTTSPNIGVASGTRYVGQPVSGGSFSVDVVMSASSGDTSGPDGTNGDGDPFNGSASCSAGVGATTIVVSTPTVILTGTTLDSSNALDILIGQGCTSSLAGIPSALLTDPPAAATPTYSWGVTGTTFQTWQATTPATPGPANSQASYEVDGPGPLTNSTAHWYWNETTHQETVSCTPTLTPPTNQGSAFPLTVSQNVTVVQPPWTSTGTGGYMQVNANCANQGSAICLYAGPASGQLGGMNWEATVNTPVLFGLFTAGQLELVQIVTPNLSYYTAAGPSLPHNDPENGHTGLDTHYPYASYSEGTSPFMTNDNPSLPLGTCYSASMQHQFNDYLLYQPPGTDVQWVPLGTFSWSTNGSAIIPSTGNWADYASENGTDAAGTVTPNGPSVPFTSTSTFPNWTLIDVFPSF
jgi:hypothetical protein